MVVRHANPLAAKGDSIPPRAMSLHTEPAIVLQLYETGDTSQVVRVLTPGHGRLSLMAKGMRRKNSRLAGVLQPLAGVEVVFSLREGAEMGTLREAAPCDDRHGLRGDLERLALASLLAEAAAESVEPGQPAPHAHALLEAALAALEPGVAPSGATMASHYLLRLLTLAGFEPTIDASLLGPWEGAEKPRVFWLDVAEGRVHVQGAQPREAPLWPVSVPAQARQVPLPPPAVRAIHVNQRTGDEDLPRLPPLPHGEATQLLDALARFTEHHLEKPLRAAKFWRGLAF